MNKTVVALLTETWFGKGNKKTKHDLQGLELRDEIKFLQKDRTTRGGRVALAFNGKVSDLGFSERQPARNLSN